MAPHQAVDPASKAPKLSKIGLHGHNREHGYNVNGCDRSNARHPTATPVHKTESGHLSGPPKSPKTLETNWYPHAEILDEAVLYEDFWGWNNHRELSVFTDGSKTESGTGSGAFSEDLNIRIATAPLYMIY